MSVSETLKTRIGIKKFILPTGNEENAVLAFEYTDKKTEVHLLKRECAPLYLEENTVVALLSDEQVGSLLLAITPSTKQGKGCSLTFKVWDSASILGFTPKEIQIQDPERSFVQDGKLRSALTLPGTADISTMKLDSLSTMVALMLDNEVLIWKAVKKDSSALTLQYYNNIKIRGGSEFILAEKSGQHSVIIADNGCLSVWGLSDSGVLVSKSVSIPPKPNGTVTLPQSLKRMSRSSIIFIDDDGRLWRYSLESNLVSIVRLPGLPIGCNVYGICNKGKKAQGLLAVCTDGHTINLYSSVGIVDSTSKGTIVYPRPFKILFSTVPINAMVFTRDDTLALASTSNRTLTIWSGILQPT